MDDDAGTDESKSPNKFMTTAAAATTWVAHDDGHYCDDDKCGDCNAGTDD